ncbi:Acyl-CoA synthetase (AMP-forming)/AMP-acid ligase II [Magnetospirillum sp. XM-1]|uniref:long-chain-fatty-acid--CoA ligase n=1 Tax=Magnetospirillum sp. XM-1 TaxID=1663591 RepID=UPI00073DDB28|nr:long-chain-fatty-acid--CoA ligase [Magnetospirillum sp. XM-1]CUW41648.1 Acyl-CoA synthetase (AMP-forming)/AMP-acid ligase II [Magnetospirillum sp. XM-1]
MSSRTGFEHRSSGGPTLGDTLGWVARYYPGKAALIAWEGGERRVWSYGELDREVNRHARVLLDLGVSRGDVVAAFLYNTPSFVFVLLAAARIGAIFNPINYRLAAQELAFILEDGGAKVVLFEHEGGDVVAKARALDPANRQWIYADPGDVPDGSHSLAALLDFEGELPPDVAVDENDPCILMYTSGTTGRPKGVLHTHRAKLAHNALMHQAMGLVHHDVGLALAPLNHTAELHTSFLPRLQLGATQVLLRRFDAAEALRLIEAEKVSHFFAAPTMINMLLYHPDLGRRDLSSIRLVEYGGASMAPHLIREWDAKVGAGLVQVYGTTEMGPCMSVLGPAEQLSLAGSAGRPAVGHDLVVARLTDDGSPTDPANPAAPGEVGEILVRGPCMMGGYLNRPEANQRALAFGWYHTGDLGELDGNGVLWIRDRIDHMINSGAENVYPREVEDALIAHPDVVEVAVVGEADPVWGQVVAAHVVAKLSASLSPEILDHFLVEGDRLAHYKRPRRYHLVPDLPKTTSGKIQKHLLHPGA